MKKRSTFYWVFFFGLFFIQYSFSQDCVNCSSLKVGSNEIDQINSLNEYFESTKSAIITKNFYAPECRPKAGREIKLVEFSELFVSGVCLLAKEKLMDKKKIKMRIENELKSLKDRTGICYSLGDPEVYRAIVCREGRSLIGEMIYVQAQKELEYVVNAYHAEEENLNYIDASGKTLYDHAYERYAYWYRFTSNGWEQEGAKELGLRLASDYLNFIISKGGKSALEIQKLK